MCTQLLFLDFDGVLHPVGASSAVFSGLPLLEALTGCRWVALDDGAGWFREGANHPSLVLCQSEVDLTAAEIIKVRKLLA